MRKAKAGTQAGVWKQKLQQRPGRNAALLTGLAAFLIQPRPTLLRTAPSTVGSAFLHQLAIKKTPYRQSHKCFR